MRLPADVLDQATARVLSQVRAEFAAYERALVAHDVQALNAFFLDSAQTRRFGLDDEQCGVEEIRRWRAAEPGVPVDRRLEQTQFQVLCEQVAVVTTRFGTGTGPALGRQTQVWLLAENGWRIASAHVSWCAVTDR
jgi:ketosteroid isomerase-like protein